MLECGPDFGGSSFKLLLRKSTRWTVGHFPGLENAEESDLSRIFTAFTHIFPIPCIKILFFPKQVPKVGITDPLVLRTPPSLGLCLPENYCWAWSSASCSPDCRR